MNIESNNIDDLIKYTSLIIPIKEDANDIIEIYSKYVPSKTKNCIKCKICGAVSGTMKIIQHTLNCKYFVKETYGPIIFGKLEPRKTHIKSNDAIGILQREYGIVGNSTSKQIIGSFGADSCVILCMRNRNTNQTILAHIDTMTLNPISIFIEFDPNECDTYLVGGDNSQSSKAMINSILLKLKLLNYTIKFAKINSYNSNSFAINSQTGEIYLDEYINPLTHLPLVIDKDKRQNDLFNLTLSKTALKKVNIN